MQVKIKVPRDKVADFCRRWKIAELDLFGSALRDDFGPESDVDVLVSFAENARWSLLDLVAMQEAAAQKMAGLTGGLKIPGLM